jgi:hypothetical protein
MTLRSTLEDYDPGSRQSRTRCCGRFVRIACFGTAVENVGVDVRAVDPRDQTSEVDDPAYRVYFWTSGGAACDEYDSTT